MIISNLEKHISSIEKNYPYYGPILSAAKIQFINDGQKRGYFTIETHVGKFQHLRIIPENFVPDTKYDFNVVDIKQIMNWIWGYAAIGMYVLPKSQNIICGMPTEHIFSYSGIDRDMCEALAQTSDSDNIIKFVHIVDNAGNKTGEAKIMKGTQSQIHCDYKTAKKHNFNFYDLQNMKDFNMQMHKTSMVIPISGNFGNNNDLKILPWNMDNIPDLNKLYNYSKALRNPMPLQEIIQFAR